MDINKLGKSFKLERGNAQGDTISPFLFNICYQILILKIETSLQINSVFENCNQRADPVPEAGDLNQGPELQQAPVSYLPRKVFAFADDCNVLMRLQQQGLTEITQILDNFSKISGLECNLEKSNIIQFCNNDEKINDTGFTDCDQITVLGMYLHKSDEMTIATNSANIARKIENQINFWRRFNLSLPGRIEIAKSMLYSQLNYLGSFLNFPVANYNCWQGLIFNFVRGNLRLSDDKISKRTNLGGLGLFEVKSFLDAQKCGWVLRAKKIPLDNWKIDLTSRLATY
jgi:hypothetical protein